MAVAEARAAAPGPALQFEYQAAAPDGGRVTGRLVARNEVALDRELGKRGLVLTHAKVVPDGGRARHRPLGHQDLVALTAQLSILLRAGVPLVGSLRHLGKRMTSARARVVVAEILRDIEAGRSFGEALDAQERSFPLAYRAAVVAGEHSMELPSVLRRQAKQLEWIKAVRGQITQALIYPALLACALAGLVTILLTFLLPRLVKLMPGGVDAMPAQTRAVMQASDFVRAHGVSIAAGLALAAGGAWLALRVPRVRVLGSGLLLRLPRLGSVLQMIATARFASTASLLHNAGCEAVRTLDLGARSCGNAALEDALGRVAESVRRGNGITESLEREPVVDPFLIQLVAVGEASGDLGDCLEQVAEAYDEEVPRQVRWALALIEPGILIVGGGIVAFLLSATILPIFSVYENLG